MREQDLPDVPTFQPLWPLPPAGTPGAEGTSVDGQGVRERLEAAAQAVLGAEFASQDCMCCISHGQRAGSRSVVLAACKDKV